MIPPPIDFTTLGQIAVLGDFDAITPIVASGQQNAFYDNMFSILEMIKVPTKSGTVNTSQNKNASFFGEDIVLSAPVLLASLSLDSSMAHEPLATKSGITATCVFDNAPHQIYIGGYFKQANLVSVSTSGGNNATSQTQNTGINYIGMYDSKLKRFLRMGNGLDGPVQDLICDSRSNQVYVVGNFRAPLKEGVEENGNNNNSNSYQNLGSFGGGVAIWKSDPQQASSANNGNNDQQPITPTKATGSWGSLPFKGLNGAVTSVAIGADGTVYFGGQFDTTADGESFSAPDTQLVNMEKVMVTTGNGEDASQDKNIICQPATNTRGNWIMRDNIPGYWRAEFPYFITPTLFRLWNLDITKEGSDASGADRGTKTFSIMTQPSNQLLNLSYIDPDTRVVQYCTVCTLLPWSISTSLHQDYQDFLVVEPKLLHAIQVDIISWYGQGGGLGGIEVYQSEIYVRSVGSLNSAIPCSSTAALDVNATNRISGDKDSTASSSFLGADWVTMDMTGGWQTVTAATISAMDVSEREKAYVDFVPYLQESGMYDVYLYTPACGNPDTPATDENNSTKTLPSNSCRDRGNVDVNMYFSSSESVTTITISQTNNVDKFDKIYSGMILHSTPDFRPHVVMTPSKSRLGTSGGGGKQTVIADSIQFVKQATLNNTNSLLFYRPGSGVAGSDEKGHNKNVHGLDTSTWGDLPTQLPEGTVVNSLATYYGSTGSSSESSLLFIGGNFQGATYNNIVCWDGSSFVAMATESTSASGVDGTVYSIALHQSTLYVVGNFQQAYGSSTGASMVGGLAMYNIQTKVWESFGNVTQNFLPGAQFHSVKPSVGSDGQPQLILSGNFMWVQGTGTSSVSIVAWDINGQHWVREDFQPNANGFPFGYVNGQVSYMNRIIGADSNTDPVVLIAGAINSMDTYKVQSPENMAWLTPSGSLKTVNLSPAISMAPLGGSSSNNFTADTQVSEPMIGKPSTVLKASAGVIYYNKDSQQWVTIVGGTRADGVIGASYFNTPAFPSPSQDSVLTYKDLDLTSASTTEIKGEIFALGINKDESNGHMSTSSANDLLLVGGAFKNSKPSGVNALALYDLAAGQALSSSMVPTLRGVDGRDPAVYVIKSRPGVSQEVLVFAGDFSGIGSGFTCELICLWDPTEARRALGRKKSIEGSFRSIYGDNVNDSKKYLGVLKGIVNDIAFEDDKNMYVAGDLEVNGVACGVASFNFETSKWTTFGTMSDSTSGSNHPPDLDTLPGPVTAIAHDSMFHRFFIAGRSALDGSAYLKKWDGTRYIHVSSSFMPTSDVYRLEILPASENAPIRTTAATSSDNDSDDNNDSSDNDSTPTTDSNTPNFDPNDTTHIVEQGFILLVSGRIVLSTSPSSSFSYGEHQESSLAFFDGQSWFPYLQSSRNVSSIHVPSSTVDMAHLNARHVSKLGLAERDVPTSALKLPQRSRDQGVFRALAIAHLPRIIARDYLSLPYVILISIAISLGLIFFIVMFGFIFVWIRRRLSKEDHASRPKFGSTVMEDGSYGALRKNGSRGRVGPKEPYYVDDVGVNQGAAFVTNTNPYKNEKSGSFFFKNRSGSKKNDPESASAILASLGIADAAAELEASSTSLSHSRSRNGSNGRLVYRPNSTIAQATDAMMTQFVKSHQQQIGGTLPDQATPPSPDRRSKKSINSLRHQPSSPIEGRGSSSSDLMNPLSQRRFSSLLGAAYDPNNPTTPISKEPTSPATTMTTPGGIVDSINGIGGRTEVLVGDRNSSGRSGGGGAGGVFYYSKFPFRAREIGELGFSAGERILVVDMSDDIWWMGVIQDPSGQQVHGVFPSNYVALTQ
ncbi:hypothetical protein BGZ76_010670 [Entomortierella beljakovae]|nr:hypothetical protein BGZ76_010670 [Entomortierella beljakovae]